MEERRLLTTAAVVARLRALVVRYGGGMRNFICIRDGRYAPAETRGRACIGIGMKDGGGRREQRAILLLVYHRQSVNPSIASRREY